MLIECRNLSGGDTESRVAGQIEENTRDEGPQRLQASSTGGTGERLQQDQVADSSLCHPEGCEREKGRAELEGAQARG